AGVAVEDEGRTIAASARERLAGHAAEKFGGRGGGARVGRQQKGAPVLGQGRRGFEGKHRGGAMVSVSLGRGQQREHGVVALAVQQPGEKREGGGAVPVVGRSAGGVGGESGIALIQEIVAANAEHLAGGQGFALAYSRQPAASLAFAG